MNALDIAAIKQRLNQGLPAIQPAGVLGESNPDLLGRALTAEAGPE